MKCIVLAAGKGTRMLPLTKDRPKQLIDVGGKPFLHYVMSNMLKAGYKEKEVAVVVGYRGEMTEQYLKKSWPGVRVIFQYNPMGTGHAVMVAERFCGKDNFVVASGDNLYSVSDLKAIQKDDGICYMLSVMSESPEKYGVVVQKDGFLTGIIEKPDDDMGDMINAGLYKLIPEIFPVLKSLGMSSRGEYELTDALTALAKRRKVKVIRGEMFVDFGCPADVKKINDFIPKD
jgi:dTDP-glucose pyrophosphorylase